MNSSSESKPSGRTWLRGLTVVLAAFGGLLVALGLALLLGLQSATVRGAVLGWVSAALEKATGIHLEARDFELSLRRGEIRLDSVELRGDGSGSSPFLVASALEAQVGWRSLLGERPQIHRLVLQNPSVDLKAPLPTPPEGAEAASEDLFPALDIHGLEIIEGSIRSAEISEDLDEWLDRWWADRVTLSGSLVDGIANVEVRGGRVVVEGHRRPEIEAALAASLTLSESREFSVEGLQLTGEALDLRLDVRGRLEKGAPIDLVVETEADLARLVPDLTPEGRLQGTGNLTVAVSPQAGLEGDLGFSVNDFPAELLAPLLASVGQEGIDLVGTHLDGEAELETRIVFDELENGPGDDDLQGSARLTWRRVEEPLIVASLSTLGPAETPGIALEVAVELLPAAEGSRSLHGTVLLPGWKDFEDLALRNVRLAVEQGDLTNLAAELGVGPEALGGFQPVGALALNATANGPALAPDLELRADWRLAGERLLELEAQSTSLDRLAFAGELLPDAPGGRRFDGRWVFADPESSLPGRFEQAVIELDEPEIGNFLARLEELLEVLVPDPVKRQTLLETLSPEVREQLQGRLNARLVGAGPLSSPQLQLTADWSKAEDQELHLESSLQDGVLTLAEVRGAVPGLRGDAEPLQFAGRGEIELENPLRRASLQMQIFDPIEGIRRLDLDARLVGGTLSAEAQAPSVSGGVEATVPLAVVLDLVPDPEGLASLPLEFDSGAVEVQVEGLDLARVTDIGLLMADAEVDDLQVSGVLDSLISFDPSDPLKAIGTLEVEGLQVRYQDLGLRSESALRIDLGDGRVELEPARLQLSGRRSEAPLDLRLTADVDPAWRAGSDPMKLIHNLDLSLQGTVDSTILTPYLAGGSATGPVSVAATATGSIEDLRAEIRIDGPNAVLLLPGRYRTRISDPELVLSLGPTGLELRDSSVRLNRGEVQLSGGWGEDEILRVSADFAGVRYRLDHGLTVLADGQLGLSWPREGRRRLSGTIDMERGSLRRNVQLERELIRMLNPSDLAVGASAFQDSMDLDITLVTREGVRIKNNVADLRADWDLIRVRGTLANPTVAGTIDVDPGGLVTAYGQTVRIDQGSMIFSGVPGEPPRMDFETTTSGEDPRLRSQWDSVWTTGGGNKGPGGGFWDRYNPQSGANAFQADEFATGLTSYFQNRFLQSISGGAPIVELSVQPLPLMGETDTTARVTMSYHLTPQISYVISQNPREAEGRTDILNLQNFAIAPSLRAQLFRNDQANHGITLQQMLELGGGRNPDDALPRLRSIELSDSDGVSKRQVRRATGLRRGQPVAEGADFDIEIDMLDAMARRGYPAAEVSVDVEAAPRNRVNVGISVEAGTRVDFEFTGDRPQRRARQDIMALYQPTGMEDSPALQTLRRDTVRALRARGFLDPQVEVTSQHLDPGNPASDRVLRIHSEGGRQVNPRVLEFPDLPDDVEAILGGMFASRLSRVELAMEVPVADQLFAQSMRAEGYPESRIESRSLSADGSTLTVSVEPGYRRRLAAVTVAGVDAEIQGELDEIRVLQPGDPLRVGEVARTAFRMEDYLRERGFAAAEVRIRYEPVEDGQESDVDLYFDVDSGLEHRIGEIRTQGLAHSSERWVESLARLEPGDLLTDSGITNARREIASTGVFQRISIQRQPPTDPDESPVVTPITFELEEHPRYRVTYGVRAESSREVGVVADVGDLNFLGRGQTLGLRVLYATLERNARLYWSIPRVRRSNKNLEFFLETRREEQPSIQQTGESDLQALDSGGDSESVVASIQEAWAQVTFPWGQRSVHRFYTVWKQSVTENPVEMPGEETKVVSPYTGWQVSFDTGERSFFETSTDKVTFFLGFDLSFSSESLGSDYTGYSWFGQMKPQVPLVRMQESALVWVNNYRTGLKVAKDDADLPFFDRLFAGGEFSVRGYPTNSLGPVSDEGIPLGGEAMFVTNQELRFPIWSLLSGVAFFDAGNVWATRSDVDSTLFTSVGAGLRADSPIGPLRVDLAFPLDRREGDPEYKVYFGLGQTF